jgi:phosphate transport system ATP-binding protein
MDAIRSRDLNLFYGAFHALKNINLAIGPRKITAMIGPSGCGKSTLLRVFNRMNDLISGVRISGAVEVFGASIFQRDVRALRKSVGMVFQRPNPFPLSILENIAFGHRVHGTRERNLIQETVRASLEAVGLWDALKDRLQHNALGLSVPTCC